MFLAFGELLLVFGEFLVIVLRLDPVAPLFRRAHVPREVIIKGGVLVGSVGVAVARPLVADDGVSVVAGPSPGTEARV
ncbi:hypothetical protein D3C86_2083830 [compost metagenome]